MTASATRLAPEGRSPKQDHKQHPQDPWSRHPQAHERKDLGEQRARGCLPYDRILGTLDRDGMPKHKRPRAANRSDGPVALTKVPALQYWLLKDALAVQCGRL